MYSDMRGGECHTWHVHYSNVKCTHRSGQIPPLVIN